MVAAYRLQLGPSLDLEGARELVPYLESLGVSHVYLSPVMRARAGSTHGYDVVDPRLVSTALGGEEALTRLAATGIGILFDIVPNHMAVDEANPFWADPTARATFFDVDPATGRHRRFFDVDHLAGVRVEDPEVFATTHATPARLIDEGVIAGLRVDHVDGLSDPAEYLARLAGLGVPVWVEKILADGEPLPAWPVEGTTGYEVLAAATSVFVDPDAETVFSELWREISGDDAPYSSVAHDARLEQARGPLAEDVRRVARSGGGLDLDEAVASLEVYRTYVVPARGECSAADRRAIGAATMPEELRRALLLEDGGRDELVRRYQQTTPAVTAKGVEDTAHYRYLRLVALNDVGMDPGRFGATVEETHRRLAAIAARCPGTLATTTTHDTKRSADVRARIAALTTIPHRWGRTVRAWREDNADLRGRRGGPDPIEEYLVYQTLVGTWPIEPARLEEYLRKALREAKRTTSWVAPDEGWEDEVLAFARGLLARPGFVTRLEDVIGASAGAARAATLGQALIRLTAAGVPDVYQADEDEYLALVDPDNRRPVDWRRLGERLAALPAAGPPPPGLEKLCLVARALRLRRRRPEAFAATPYEPLAAGPDVLAFARGGRVAAVIPVRPAGRRSRLVTPVALEGTWENLLSGASLRLEGTTPVAGILGALPVALLERVAPG